MRGIFLFGCVIILAGCQNHAEAKNTTKTAALVDPKSPWVDTSFKDSETGEVTHAVIVTDDVNKGSMTIACGADGDERLAFGSDLFLGSGQMGKVMARFEEENVTGHYDAFLYNDTALLDKPKHSDWKNNPMRAMSEFQAYGAIEKLRNPHDRLRVRLTALNGKLKHLDFKISGNAPKIAALEKQCGIPNDRPALHNK